MSSSSAARVCQLVALAGAILGTSRASAQQQAQGFAAERFDPSPAGAGWLVMDDLEMRGRLGGAMALTTSYAMNPLQVSDGAEHLNIVSNQAFADFGLAVTHNRWRFFLNIDAPLVLHGDSGIVGGDQYSAPDVTLGSHPTRSRTRGLGPRRAFMANPAPRSGWEPAPSSSFPMGSAASTSPTARSAPSCGPWSPATRAI